MLELHQQKKIFLHLNNEFLSRHGNMQKKSYKKY